MYSRRIDPVSSAEATESTPEASEGTPDVVDSLRPSEQLAWLAFIAIHAPLGIWMSAQSMIVFGQGALAFVTGLWWALNPAKPERVAYLAAYIVGSEVLWRMITDALPWESAKYGLIVIFATSLLNRRGLSSLIGPALFFGLLLPSAVITIRDNDATVVRGLLSFNLSGPLALVVCSQFFARLELSPARTLRLFLSLVAPVVAIGAIVVTNIVTAEKIVFTFESNFATSGGFGPNQVSLALGLGALASLWCLLERGVVWPVRVSLFGIMVWLLTQSALTFSRGGLLGALISGAVAIAFLMTHAETRRKLILVVPLVVVIATYVVWPTLVQFTGGALATRYAETGLSRRDELGSEDLVLWEDNPILGVGPGLSPRHHRDGVAAHTEFTRLLAEHGLFGAFAIVLLLGLGLNNIRKAASAREKGLVASALIWSLLFMVNSAMRTVAPSFMYGLCFNIFKPTAEAKADTANDDGGPLPERRRYGAGPEPSAAA